MILDAPEIDRDEYHNYFTFDLWTPSIPHTKRQTIGYIKRIFPSPPVQCLPGAVVLGNLGLQELPNQTLLF